MNKIGIVEEKKNQHPLFWWKDALFYFLGYLDYNNANPYTLQQSGRYTCILPRNIIQIQRDRWSFRSVSNVNKDNR